jgi:hypothetical protein
VSLLLLVVHTVLAGAAIVVSILGVQSRTAARARRMATALFATVAVQSLVGDVLYPIYLSRAKPLLVRLEAGSRSVADVFDVKEHLAFFALVFSIGVFVLTRTEPKPTTFHRLLFGCAHGAIVLVAALGLVVASVRTP